IIRCVAGPFLWQAQFQRFCSPERHDVVFRAESDVVFTSYIYGNKLFSKEISSVEHSLQVSAFPVVGCEWQG
ncbi:hypothetical protein, partial [Pseudomonas sp. PB106]|uniref:hypothetical protein n=1 Tax=Pseudomonas sp. PB106 TaxID=2494699 RepID=UPI001C49BEB5